jgi:hypothetical protein
MKDVIEMLLDKQATLEADKEAEKALACEKIDAEYAERAGKISAMLDLAGYEPPVLVETDETTELDELDEVDAAGELSEEQADVTESVNVGVQVGY